MKQKLVDKLRLEGKTLTWFWQTKIKETCNIGYSTFANQIGPVLSLRSDVRKIIENYIEESE